MKLNTSYYSNIGGRKRNEDAVSIQEYKNSVLVVVCDGLGGHADGDVASRIAVNTVNMELGQKLVKGQELASAIEKANFNILHDPMHSRMNSTIAVLWFDDRSIIAGNVGDTRIYQFRNGEIIYQSKDHSVAFVSVLTGEITQNELREDRNRNVLTRALGAEDEVKPEIHTLDLKNGDAFLICSDGFWEYVLESDMEEMLKKSFSADEWLELMRCKRNEVAAPKNDNHSAVAIMIESKA